ncbi:hypothetical protein FHG64_04185 [Antarcticibacterium flavum]|uniref:Uncharacterized protein n=1 Tax=Antarcticibacterium flavum TaxID=2058175 RepID=A0A5B7WZM1_9FLAO|nr:MULTISPECIES: hypothetical protein [Antarcticibacterium]MCM4160273.1 hypothetical protein [Antarcticibacterium sp. W02-3]QCY68656.1 hypothetical protein FHG64_04185 [Antarcticibacterium flavum]
MKNFKLYLSAVAVFAMLFTSCSKDETNPSIEGEKATLTFGALVNDLVANRAASKQAVADLPECTDDTPAFVEIALSLNGTDVVGDVENPFRVDLVSGQIFTKEVAELELDPNVYSLDYFTVHNADGDVIWIAPQTGSALGEFVDVTLPLSIDLRAGVKKYVDVPVLCYDNRDVNEYGYLFFELDTNQAIKFCIFGNYCPPSEGGRHYPAEYSVSVWSGTDATGTPLYTDVQNQTGTYDNGDFYAEPLCFALPDTDGTDDYYFEITLRSSDEYGNVEERVIRQGSINDVIVKSFFDGDDNLDYYHFREGCDGDDGPPIFETPGSEAEYYATCAYPMNNSNSVALAYFEVKDNMLKATILAAGVTPNQQHPQHIHGPEDGSNATCPPMSADANGDGLISLAEGLPYYGGVQLSLNNEDGSFPTANAAGFYNYQRTFDLTGTSLSAWENLAVVVHGRNVGGSYDATLPVACGQVNNLNSNSH